MKIKEFIYHKLINHNKSDKKNYSYKLNIHLFASAITFLLLLLPFIFAQSQQPTEQTVPKGCEVALQLDFGNQSTSNPIGVEQNWKSLSLIGLLASFALLSIMFLIAKALDASSLLARVKTDIIQIFVTAIMLGVLYSVILVFCSVDLTQFGFADASFFDTAGKYFDYAESLALSAYLKMMNSIMYISALSRISVNAPSFLPLGNFVKIGLYTNLLSGTSVALGGLNWFSSLIMLSISLLHGYKVVLYSIQTYFLNLLLPVGVVLRCFSPTRDLGGAFIALALGLWFFYPILFSFSYMIINSPQPVSPPQLDWESSITVTILALGPLTIVPLLGGGAFLLVLSGSLNTAVDMFNSGYIEVGKTLLPVFLLPAINWIILVAIVRELSRAFGQEVDISGLARMI
ncbi:MAG: hypothetical protein QXE90_00965 [Candidatus Micrarchaeia archaeon]